MLTGICVWSAAEWPDPIEARYNQVQISNSPSLKFIPITFGVMF